VLVCQIFKRNYPISIQIPIYRGAEFPLTVTLIHEPYHGEDGFGDADLPPIEPVLAEGHAVDALIRWAEEYPGKFSFNYFDRESRQFKLIFEFI